jgi:uncharacterized membrane protein
MTPKNKKLIIITSLLTLLPIPVGLVLWNKFPETMAIHWGITGQADGFASVPTAVFLMPLIMLLTHLFCILVCFLDPGNRNQNKKILHIVLWTVPVICNLSCCGIYALALGVEFSPVFWTMVPMGLLFALIGNYMPKTRMNSTVGIKVPWTYTSEENWKATHRLAGKLWVGGGILMALGGFLPNGWAVAVMFGLILPMTVVPIVYSWRFYEQEKKQGKDIKAGYSSVDKQIMKGSGIFLILITAFVLFMLFFGDIHYVFNEDHLLVDANMYTDYVLRYDTIEDIEYWEGKMPGLRVGGFGSFRLLMGFFENEEFGTHTRYTYYDPDACIVLTVRGKAVVLSAETTEETRTLYETLLAKIN